MLAYLDEALADLHAVLLADMDKAHHTGDAAAQVVEHLHCLDNGDDVALLHLVANVDAQLIDDAGEGRDERPYAVDEALGLLLSPRTAAAGRLHLVAAAGDLKVEALLLLADQHLEDAVVEREDVAGRFADALEADGIPVAVDVDAWPLRSLLQLGLDLAVTEPQEVLRQEPPPCPLPVASARLAVCQALCEPPFPLLPLAGLPPPRRAWESRAAASSAVS